MSSRSPRRSTSAPSVFLAVPTRGSIDWATVTRLEEIHAAGNLTHPICYQVGTLSVAQTRNLIVERFRATDCDVLVMVDDDVVPPPHMLDAVAHLGRFDVVCHPHPMLAGDTLALGIFKRDGEGYSFVEPERGAHEVDAVATGCVLITRRILERVQAHLNDLPFTIPDDPHARLTSDDFIFCEDVKAAGGRIGYVWDGAWCSDHRRKLSMAPLLERQRVDSIPV